MPLISPHKKQKYWLILSSVLIISAEHSSLNSYWIAVGKKEQNKGSSEMMWSKVGRFWICWLFNDTQKKKTGCCIPVK